MQDSPLTVTPGQIIGYVNGRPVRAIAGGSEPVVTPPADPAAPPAAVVPTPPPAAVNPFAGWDGKVETLPDDAQRIIREARQEAADNRVAKNTEVERRNAILKAAGIETDEEDPIKALETERQSNQSLATENRTLRVELALGNAARSHGADESLLVAVLAHQGELAKLDPTASDFTSKLDALVKTTVEKNPKLKAAQAAAASGVSAPGGPGPAADIDAQIAAATKAGDHRLSIALKRQKAYAPRV